MTEKLYAHVNNEADRQALIALLEKERNVRARIDEKDDDYRRDILKNEPVSKDEFAELASLMSAIGEIAKKYDHLLPEMEDPYADFLS